MAKFVKGRVIRFGHAVETFGIRAGIDYLIADVDEARQCFRIAGGDLWLGFGGSLGVDSFVEPAPAPAAEPPFLGNLGQLSQQQAEAQARMSQQMQQQGQGLGQMPGGWVTREEHEALKAKLDAANRTLDLRDANTDKFLEALDLRDANTDKFLEAMVGEPELSAGHMSACELATAIVLRYRSHMGDLQGENHTLRSQVSRLEKALDLAQRKVRR